MSARKPIVIRRAAERDKKWAVLSRIESVSEDGLMNETIVERGAGGGLATRPCSLVFTTFDV